MHVIYLYFTQCVLLHITGGYRSQEYITVVINHSDESRITVNGERFAGLNFHVFHNFQRKFSREYSFYYTSFI